TRRLMLGGVYVPDADGLAGYSDGDVVLHAVVDALLGAAGMGDIGSHFPDTEPKWEDVDSKEFLFIVKEMLAEQRWLIVNIDVIIHAEEPYLGSVKPQIKRCIASLLGIDFNAVNIKAKTNEGLGEIGEGEAIAATAIALLKRKYKRTL
ncbi:MAG: 2-C-methyl-D-erythritol 2,4-cyclodiphosphate synthase, partial [Planctomycetota bacterium]